jgi:hypothetical protein
MPLGTINVIKVFSSTKARDRSELGERITTWLRAHPNVEIADTTVSLTSDSEFHCLSIVLIGYEKGDTAEI